MVIVVVYEVNDREEHPVLLSKDAKTIEYWIRKGNLDLDTYEEELPRHENYIEHPVSVTVVK